MSLKSNYIELAKKKYGGSYALISKGIKKGIVQSIMGGSIPKANELYEVAKVLGVSLERLLTGQETMPEIVGKEEKYDLVPQVEGYISGGPGSFPSNEIKGWLWIPKEFLPGSGDGLRYAAVEVKGVSMEPLLSNGETVVVDRTDTALENIKRESLYAVWKDGHHQVKFVHYNPKERVLQLVSYNQDYARQHGVEIIKLEKGMDNPVEGKVVFSFRRWK